MRFQDTYIQYGVDRELAAKLEGINLPVTTFRNTSDESLVARYGLSPDEIRLVKDCITRKPVPADTVRELLERSNYTCCVCHGAKSSSYVVHHIEEYALTRNNSYSNLAVLCPADHDLAHMKGRGLSARLTADQIRHAKAKWEALVERQNVMRACNVGDISHVEFCNIPRIYDLCLQHFGSIPEVPLTSRMLEENLILPSGFVNDEFLNGRYPDRLVTPLKYPFAGGAGLLRSYLFQLFQEVVKVTGVEDLDSLLNRTAVAEGNLVGRMCLYVGGVYGKQPQLPVTEHTPMVHMYLRRKPFFVEWIVDPHFATADTSLIRLGGRNIHFIYGSIRSVGVKVYKGEKFIHYDIAPDVLGIPNYHIDRCPVINNPYGIDLDEFFD